MPRRVLVRDLAAGDRVSLSHNCLGVVASNRPSHSTPIVHPESRREAVAWIVVVDVIDGPYRGKREGIFAHPQSEVLVR
jgi:hypothetical protein